MQKAFNAITKAQYYPDDIREWQHKDTATKTWANFKVHFTKKAKDYRKANSTTMKSSGY